MHEKYCKSVVRDTTEWNDGFGNFKHFAVSLSFTFCNNDNAESLAGKGGSEVIQVIFKPSC